MFLLLLTTLWVKWIIGHKVPFPCLIRQLPLPSDKTVNFGNINLALSIGLV